MKSLKQKLGIPEGMMRVISCHHFLSQDVFLSENEPLAMCMAQEKLLVATVQHCVEVRDLDRRGQILHTFPTVDQVKQLIYCDSANYVATLERKSSRHTKPLITYVRAYLNWWIDMKGQPMRVRIAGCVTTTTNQIGSGQLEMVELPLNDVAVCIACCKTNGTLAVGVSKSVQVYSFSKQKVNDFEHLMDIQIAFDVIQLNICEDFFACLSNTSIQVFQVVLEADVNGAKVKETIIERNETDDENCVHWNFDSFYRDKIIDEVYRETLSENLHPNSFPIEIRMRSVERFNSTNLNSESEPEELLGPCVFSKNCRIEVQIDTRLEGWNQTKVSVVTLLYKRFIASMETCGLHGLHLLPVYFASNDERHVSDPLSAAVAAAVDPCLDHSTILPSLRSSVYLNLTAVGCFFTAAQEGFLYDVTSDLSNRTELISHYTYTALVKSVAIEANILHVLTETGLESYTLHLPHRALHHSHTKKVYPSSSDPVCLVGLRPFFGVEQLVMSERHLVLVSTTDDSLSSTDSIDGSSCTVYSLRKPTPTQLFQDIFEVGLLNRLTCPSTYLHLLSEGHMVLRILLATLGSFKCSQEFISLYRESCALVGDHYACSSLISDHNTAVSYYVLSELPLENIFQRCRDLKAQTKSKNVYQCLTRYFDVRLLANKHSATADLPLSMAETILELFFNECPQSLWRVILQSNISSYRSEKAMMLLKKRITSKKSVVGDHLAIAVLLFRKNNEDAAQNMILSVTKEELVPVLIEVVTDHMIINCHLTEFAQLVSQSHPDAFVDFLLGLMLNRIMQPEHIIRTLIDDMDEERPENIPLLKGFLEAFLSDKKASVYSSRPCNELLLKIYLRRLQHVSKPTASRLSGHSLTKSANLFGLREPWLADLPPFNGRGISRSCHQKRLPIYSASDDWCTCWHCNEDLLRLQSFLCANIVSIKSDLKKELEGCPSTMKGYLSLKIISSDWLESVEILALAHPQAILPYALDTFGNDRDRWCQLFAVIKKEWMNHVENDSGYALYNRILCDLLAHLSEMLSPDELLDIIPPAGDSLDSFQPYVRRSCEKLQANILKEKIIAIGLEVKAMM